MQETADGEKPLGDDLMIGAKTVAGWMGLPLRQVFYMAEEGQLPMFKIGSKWAGRKSTITAHIAQLETAQLETAGKAA